MAWSDPPAVAAGEVISASDQNTYVKDNIIYCHSGKPATAINRNNTTPYTPGTSFADVDATNLSITISTTTGRVEISAQCTFQASTADNMDCHLDVAIDGTRQGGSNGIAVDSVTDPKTKGVGFHLIVTGLSVGSHTFRLQAKQAYASSAGTILSSSVAFVHFSVHEI